MACASQVSAFGTGTVLLYSMQLVDVGTDPDLGFGRRHMRLMRHLTSADWDNAAIEKSNLPRYMLSQKSFEEVPVWILSLQRSPERRASILVQLTAANISFEFVDAVDGQGLLPAEEVP